MDFTLLLLLLFLLIYISGRKNNANKWCAISGIFFCIGTFKEYFYFDLVPVLSNYFGSAIGREKFIMIYSIMTALLYYLALPTAIISIFYFTNFDIRKKKAFRLDRIFIFIPPLIISLFYNPVLTSYYQLTSKIFWYVVSIYNVGYGTIITVLLFLNVTNDKNKITRRQKRLVNIVFLPGLWYWLITIFIIHSLGIKSLFKIWKGNIVIVSIIIIYYVIMAFKEGIMGLRLKKESYNLENNLKIINKSASFIRHLTKNEIIKIEWCTKRLKSKYEEGTPEEIDIIDRSLMHLKDFIEKTKKYSDEIILDKNINEAKGIILESISLMKGYVGDKITISLKCPDKILIQCDKLHMVEVFNNLIMNSADAMNGTGAIDIQTCFDKRRQYFNISVRDTGAGIDKKDIPLVLNPFYSTKKNKNNFGLGLSYCSNVMEAHEGYIDLKSSKGNGTTATLHFPINIISEGENAYEENKNIVCRG